MSNENQSWRDRFLDHITHPVWRNPYLRLMVFTLLFLHVDSIVLLTSNYKLHEYLTSRTSASGERIFRFAWLIDLHSSWKLLIALATPALWFILNFVTSKLVVRYNQLMASFDKLTSRELSISELRQDWLNEREINKSLHKEKKKQKDEFMEKEIELNYYFKKSYSGLIDLHSYLKTFKPDYVEDFLKWRKETNYSRFDVDLSSLLEKHILEKLNNKFASAEISEVEEAMHDPEGYRKRIEEEEMKEYHVLQDEMQRQYYQEGFKDDAEKLSKRRWNPFR